MLQWGRVGEDAEVRRSQCRDLVHVSCFNGAASVRTRKFGCGRSGIHRGLSLQWGRVGEDAEVFTVEKVVKHLSRLQWGRVGEDAEVRIWAS